MILINIRKGRALTIQRPRMDFETGPVLGRWRIDDGRMGAKHLDVALKAFREREPVRIVFTQNGKRRSGNAYIIEIVAGCDAMLSVSLVGVGRLA